MPNCALSIGNAIYNSPVGIGNAIYTVRQSSRHWQRYLYSATEVEMETQYERKERNDEDSPWNWTPSRKMQILRDRNAWKSADTTQRQRERRGPRKPLYNLKDAVGWL